jgi:hypothetical protein
MTTNAKISQLLKNTKNFGGVIFYDQVDRILELDHRVYVINYVTVAESMVGLVGHFVVIDGRTIPKGANDYRGDYFFDPYGLKPDEARNILKLPNTLNITRLINRTRSRSNARAHFEINDTDFQAVAPYDSLCGVYSIIYIKNPSFKTNLAFVPGVNRLTFDQRLSKLAVKLGVLNIPPEQLEYFENIKQYKLFKQRA